MKKTVITLERHKEIGKMLKEMQSLLFSLHTELSNNYKKTDKQVVLALRGISRAKEGLCTAKNYLENQLLNIEHTELLSENREEALNIYYGPIERTW